MVEPVIAMTIFPSNTPVDRLVRSNGLGVLTDAIDPLVTYDLTGTLDLEFKYPSSGINFDTLSRRAIIMAKPTRYKKPFPFRIYEISKPLNGLVSVKAEDITHDLSAYTVSPFTMVPDDQVVDEVLGTNWRETGYVYVDEYLAYVLANCDIPVNDLKYSISINEGEAKDIKDVFTYKIQADANGEVSITKPLTLRNLLGDDTSVGLIGIFGGCWGYSIDYNSGFISMTLFSTQGSDRGVQIRYGKNMTGMNYTESTTGQYTGIYPYWYKSSEGFVDLLTDEPNSSISIRGLYSFSDKIGKYRYCVDAYDDDGKFADYEILYNYILPVDLTGKFQQMPTSDELWDEATKYIKENNIGFPAESLTVEFIDLSQSEEFKDVALLEEIRLGDIVTVLHPEMKVTASMMCNKMVYNVKTGKYKSLDLGKPVILLSDTIAELGMQTAANEDAIKKTKVQHSFVFDDVTLTLRVQGYNYWISERRESTIATGPLAKDYPIMIPMNIPSSFDIKPYMYCYANFESVDDGNYFNSRIEAARKTKITSDGKAMFFLRYSKAGKNPSIANTNFEVRIKSVEFYYYV